MNIKLSVPDIWRHYYNIKGKLVKFVYKYTPFIYITIIAILMVSSWLYLNKFNTQLSWYFLFEGRIQTLKTVFLTLGGALIGAAAISFSLIMFAMQINVERMPHGLFRKFNSDYILLSCFIITFVMAITICCLSMLPISSWPGIAIFVAAWGVIIIFIIFLIAYNRALILINPLKQLSILIDEVEDHLNKWSKAATRCSPIFGSPDETNSSDGIATSHDINRFSYLSRFPEWTSHALSSIQHCVSYTRRYAENGDYEISKAALSAIVQINSKYIKSKGKTFFNNNPFIENPLYHDALIQDTLEHLRQNIQIGISRGDEQQLEQSLNTLGNLCALYHTIDYSSRDSTKTHAVIASGYLTSSVKDIAPHDFVDVTMEGLRIMGKVGGYFISHSNPDDVASISENISDISIIGIVKKANEPVILTAIEQLSILTISLINSKNHDVHFPLKDIRNQIKLIIVGLLHAKPESRISSASSTYLAPYYSNYFLTQLAGLSNIIMEADNDNDDAKVVLSHIEQWADGIYESQKEILLLTIEKKSHLAFHIISWIEHIAKILFAISSADCCEPHTSEELKKHALWLAYVLSYVPDDIDAISFVEAYNMTDTLFKLSINAKTYDCDHESIELRDLLMSWGFKAGKHTTGFSSLEKTLYGLICLNILSELEDNDLINDIKVFLDKSDAPNADIRTRISSNIRNKANNPTSSRYLHREIDSVMGEIDEAKLQPLMIQVADVLNGNTSN